jgi:hypothetical protein
MTNFLVNGQMLIVTRENQGDPLELKASFVIHVNSASATKYSDRGRNVRLVSEIDNAKGTQAQKQDSERPLSSSRDNLGLISDVNQR